MTERPRTPSQTVGPFFHHALGWVTDVCRGTDRAVALEGTVFDGDDEPVTDAIVELWNADTGWARAIVDAAGTFRTRIDKPPAVIDDVGTYAPSLRVTVFARGLLQPVVTRLYFPGEPANERDPLLRECDTSERATLIARVEDSGLRFDVHLQGPQETVFFVA